MTSPIATKLSEVVKLFPEYLEELDALLDRKIAEATASLNAGEVEMAERAGVALSSVVLSKRRLADRQADRRGEPIPSATALNMTNADLENCRLAGVSPKSFLAARERIVQRATANAVALGVPAEQAKAQAVKLHGGNSDAVRGAPQAF
jgi:hypothetical protein